MTADEKEHQRQIQLNITAAALRAKASRLEAEARNPQVETPTGVHLLRAVGDGYRKGKADAAADNNPMSVREGWLFVLFAAFGMKIIEGAVWGFAFTATPDWYAVLYVLLLIYSVILLVNAYRDRRKARTSGDTGNGSAQ